MNGMTFDFDTPHGRMIGTMLGNDPRDRQPSHGRDREVVAPSPATLHEFGDVHVVRNSIEGKIQAPKLGADVDNVPGTRHTRFRCHVAFLLREPDLMHCRWILLHPPHQRADGHQTADRAWNFRIRPRSWVVAACAGYQNLHDALQRRQDGLANRLRPGEEESIGPDKPLRINP